MHEKNLNCGECIKMHEQSYPLLRQYEEEDKEILNSQEQRYTLTTIPH